MNLNIVKNNKKFLSGKNKKHVREKSGDFLNEILRSLEIKKCLLKYTM